MLSSNDIVYIQSLIADGYATRTAKTTDATPVTVHAYQLSSAEVILVEVICVAMKDGTDAFAAKIAKSFFYDGTTITAGSQWTTGTQYLGTGLSTCGVSFTTSGDTVSIVWTGEATTNIAANFRIQITSLFSEVLPP